jgi:hypothetical protein
MQILLIVVETLLLYCLALCLIISKVFSNPNSNLKSRLKLRKSNLLATIEANLSSMDYKLATSG